MKIDISNFSGNIYNVFSKAGYYADRLQRKGTVSFSRRILQDRYPRFHVYCNIQKKEISLHLDQKAPKYESSHDHGAEYSGPLLRKEAQRIEEIFFNN